MKKLKCYIARAKAKLSKQVAHSCENWGQAEIRKARELIDYEHYSESINLVREFEKWLGDRV